MLDRVSVVPSPQLTVRWLTLDGALLTVKVTITVAPSLAGFGVRLVIETTGTFPTVSVMLAELVCPAPSVAFTVTVKVPLVVYAWF